MPTSGLLFQLKSWARFIFPSAYLAPYHPTPEAVANKMLKLAGVGPSDIVCDIGCGNASLLIAACKGFRAHGIGYELDDQLVKEARDRVQKEGFGNKIQIYQEDARFATGIEKGTVLMLYLSEQGNKVLIDALQPRIRADARVVSFTFPIRGHTPKSEERTSGISIFLFDNIGTLPV